MVLIKLSRFFVIEITLILLPKNIKLKKFACGGLSVVNNRITKVILKNRIKNQVNLICKLKSIDSKFRVLH